ncbi:MAG: hypothetical protein WEC75_12850 [Dehalococcoidia bacterium]
MTGEYGLTTEDLPLLALPDGAAGVDAGLTLTKVVRAAGGAVRGEVAPGRVSLDGAAPVGVTGAAITPLGLSGVETHELDAAARGAMALCAAAGRPVKGPFVLALLGTGTGTALVREGAVTHLGGTALGGGSFAGIGRRVAPELSYTELLAAAHRGDRRNADLLIADAYPEGIGRIGADLTAAHLARTPGGSLDDFLAGLLNLHAENIAQIVASRARIAGVDRVVLAGGFAHGNPALVASLSAMAGMFGLAVDLAPSPGYAGAVGAALIAVEATGGRP